MAWNWLDGVTAKMLALVFLGDSWEFHKQRQNADRTSDYVQFNVTPTLNSSYGVLRTDTVKLFKRQFAEEFR